MNYGFAAISGDVVAVDPAHPAFAGPLLPTATTMFGTWYAHGTITGTGYTNVLVDLVNPTSVILAEKCWGSGRVMVGSMTTFNWHDPDPQAENFRSNIMNYMHDNGCGTDCIDSVEVVVVGSPTVEVDTVLACVPVDVSDIPLVLDDGGLLDNVTEWYTEIPDSLGDPADLWPAGDPVEDGDVIYVVYGSPSSGCFDVELVNFEFIYSEAGEDGDTSVCNSGAGGVLDVNVLLEGADLPGTWEDVSVVPTTGFDPATGMFDPTGVPEGVYVFNYMTVVDDPCPNDTASMTVTVFNQYSAGADNNDEICNEAGFFIDVNGLLSGHDPGGFWEAVSPTGGAFDPVTGVFTMDGTLAAGDYEFHYIVLGTDPCINDTSVHIVEVLELPGVDAGPDQEICAGDETTVNVTVTGAFGGTTVWDPVGITDGTPFTPGEGTLTYTVTFTDLDGCVNSDQMDITVHPLPELSFTTSETVSCVPFPVDFEVTSSTVIDAVVWNFGDGTTAPAGDETEYTHTYVNDGIFTVSVQVTDVNGCVNSIAYVDYITAEKMPVARFSANPPIVSIEDTEVEFDNESTGATEYLWSFDDGSDLTNETDPTHFFPAIAGENTYDVILRAYNYLGCVDSTVRKIIVKDIIVFYVPDAFTPDGDNYNDKFQPVFISGFDPYDFHLMIFNRWGEIVFESFDATVGWDGTYGSLGLAEDGVYVWSIDFKELHTDKLHRHTGHVTLVK